MVLQQYILHSLTQKINNAEIMRQLAILIKDKDLDFNAPAVIFLKEYYAIIFVFILILTLAF